MRRQHLGVLSQGVKISDEFMVLLLPKPKYMGPRIKDRSRNGSSIIFDKLLAEISLSVPRLLRSAVLMALVLKGGMLPQGDAALVSLNWNLRLAVWGYPIGGGN